MPRWLMTVFCPSISSEGKSGVPGGVKSLKTHTIIVNIKDGGDSDTEVLKNNLMEI